MALLTVAQAALRRKTTVYSIHRWIRGGLKAQRVGSIWLIHDYDLAEFKPRRVGRPANIPEQYK